MYLEEFIVFDSKVATNQLRLITEIQYVGFTFKVYIQQCGET